MHLTSQTHVYCKNSHLSLQGFKLATCQGTMLMPVDCHSHGNGGGGAPLSLLLDQLLKVIIICINLIIAGPFYHNFPPGTHTYLY